MCVRACECVCVSECMYVCVCVCYLIYKPLINKYFLINFIIHEINYNSILIDSNID